MGPKTAAGQAIFAMKYGQPGEDWRAACNRVAATLTTDPDHYRACRDIQLNMRFIPGGRILSAIGTTKGTTAYNCFVSGTIEDSFVKDEGNIMQRATEAAATMRLGGGIGYDFSKLRPRGTLIKKINSHSSGPVAFLEIFDAVCHCVSSSGHRRGAQMGMLRVDHPDIEEFIDVKRKDNALSGFNLSVAVTDAFMRAVQAGGTFPLQWNGETYREINAAVLWEKIMRSTWDWGDPGVVFIDRINGENNLAYCETIAATNPCAEQPLPPFGACLLGSFNLTKYIRVERHLPKKFGFDWGQLRADIPYIVAMMDRVVDVSTYPLEAQRHEALQKRRMGLGVTGVANALEALELPYGSEKFREYLDAILAVIKNRAYMASAMLAMILQPFPLFNRDKYMARPFIKGLEPKVQEAIARHGIRNSHLTSIAPTGTISMLADNVSGGIEPVFMHEYERLVNTPEGQKTLQLTDYGVKEFGVFGMTANEISAEEHIAVLTTAQKHIDSSISKTCNVSSDMPWESFKDLYMTAWLGGAKSCSTFQTNGGKRGSIMSAAPTACTAEACEG